jgi:hypothetical protein
MEYLERYPPGREWKGITNKERENRLESDPVFKERFETAVKEHEEKLATDPVYRVKHISMWATQDIRGRIKIEAILHQACGKWSVEIPRRVWLEANWVCEIPDTGLPTKEEVQARLKAVLDKYGYDMPTLHSEGNVFAKKRQ